MASARLYRVKSVISSPGIEVGILLESTNGAEGGSRTRTSLRTRDFKSRASTNSATPASVVMVNGKRAIVNGRQRGSGSRGIYHSPFHLPFTIYRLPFP